MLQDNQPWRLIAALADTNQGAHFQIADVALVENICGQTDTIRHFASALCDNTRGLSIRRLIDQTASPVDGFANDGAFIESLLLDSWQNDLFEGRPAVRSLVRFDGKGADQCAGGARGGDVQPSPGVAAQDRIPSCQ